jgi:hypothetical protein
MSQDDQRQGLIHGQHQRGLDGIGVQHLEPLTHGRHLIWQSFTSLESRPCDISRRSILYSNAERRAFTIEQYVLGNHEKELATLQVEVKEDKTWRVDRTQGERFGFLGFEFRRIRSRRD